MAHQTISSHFRFGMFIKMYFLPYVKKIIILKTTQQFLGVTFDL